MTKLYQPMTNTHELSSEVEEEYDEVADDWDIPDPEEEPDDWSETWLDGIESEDVEGYTFEEYWEV